MVLDKGYTLPRDKVEQDLIDLLRKITPTSQCLELFIALLRRNYMKRIAILRKRKEEADTELTKLYSQRQTLIEKNLAGIYPDEIFKEQNAIIEERIISVRAAKDDSLLQKYNLEETVKFVKSFFVDLGNTYQKSSLTQKKALLSSIFNSKLAWSYPGFSNSQISPIYQSIRHFDEQSVTLGAESQSRTDI